MTQDEQKPLLTTIETAQKLGIDPKTVRAWLKAGTCPVAPIEGVKPPKWRRVDVDKFLTGGSN